MANKKFDIGHILGMIGLLIGIIALIIAIFGYAPSAIKTNSELKELIVEGFGDKNKKIF